jgi:hypothetical protein
MSVIRFIFCCFFTFVLFVTPSFSVPYRASLEGNNIFLITDESVPSLTRELLTEVIQNKRKVTPHSIKKFWHSLDHFQPHTDERRAIIRDRLLGDSLLLPSLFYKDALISLYFGYVFKSEHRENYEKRLIDLGVITIATLSEHQKMIEKMLALDAEAGTDPSKPKQTRTGLESLITRFDAIESRINDLFTLPSLAKDNATRIPKGSEKPTAAPSEIRPNNAFSPPNLGF